MASSDRLRARRPVAHGLVPASIWDVLRRFTDHATAVTGAAATAVSLWDQDRTF
jgi:hypothetical protein